MESGLFLTKAKEISAEVALFIERLMDSKLHPEQGYKACSGVLNLARRVGKQRITGACKRAIEFGAYHYYILEDILSKGLDQHQEDLDEVPQQKATPTHKNVRGKLYYKKPSSSK